MSKNSFFIDYQVKIATEFVQQFIYRSNDFSVQNSAIRSLTLTSELKSFFSGNRKFGKRDRTFITELCFSYFRSAGLFLNLNVEEHFFAGLYLSSKEYNESEKFFMQKMHSSIMGESFSIMDFKSRQAEIFRLFPHAKANSLFNLDLVQAKEFFSDSVDFENWQKSFFYPSGFFIRIKLEHKKEILEEFSKKNIFHQDIEFSEIIFLLKLGTKVDDCLTYQKGYFEIQDLSSQMLYQVYNPKPNEFWWDACAASGGKSLLLLEKEPFIQLTASDIRTSILQNYEWRLKKLGYTNFQTFVVDLSQESNLNSYYDGILLDVPCSGSGTWKRNPENRFFSSNDKIVQFSNLQRKIIDNVIPYLKTNGQLIYSTCSVFKKENEDQVNYIKEKHGLSLVSAGILHDFTYNSDWIFYAVFSKKNEV